MALRVALCIALLWWASEVISAWADHLVFLPLVPNTPLIQSVSQTREHVWCLDARAASYPNFAAQVSDVNDQYFGRVGISHRQVDFADSACQVRHTMPDLHGCGSGCAAWIFYANWPVIVEYKYQLGYTDWRSTVGHELGHGLLGLHEQYRDSGGTISCTGRLDTVMDCGSGVRYPQALDVARGCAAIATSWCGQAVDPCLGPTAIWGGVWDACIGRWVAADGWQFDPAAGVWYRPDGVAEWGPCDLVNRDCWNIPAGRWVYAGSLLFDPASGFFSRPPLP